MKTSLQPSNGTGTKPQKEDLTALLELGREILQELRAVRGLLTQPSRSRSAESDREVLAVLLPAIAGKFGSNGFTTRELFEDPAIRELISGYSPRQVGRMLARCRRPVNSLCVESIGSEQHATVWGVKRQLTE